MIEYNEYQNSYLKMIDYKDYPSVTRILASTKPKKDVDALNKWRERIGVEEADRISLAAIERGNNYDKLVQDYCNGIEIPHIALKNHLDRYEIVSTEQDVCSHQYQYKGRYDCIFAKNGIVVLNDFKGSTKRKTKYWLKDYPLQIAAYIKAIEETGIVINWGMISVILEDDIQIFTFDHCEIQYNFDKFLKRLNQYNNEKYANL